MIEDIIRIDYGRSVLSEDAVYEGGDIRKNIPIVFSVFLVKTEDRRILVDAGCETMPGWAMEDFIGPIARLKELGYEPSDITDVIITHADHDHIECVNYFKDAAIHIQRYEYERGKDYIPEGFDVQIFDDEYVVDDEIRVVKIGGHQIGSCIVECQKDGKTYVLCGDECYSFYNLKHKVPTAATKSKENSTYFVNKYSDSSKYICLLCHEK